MAIFESLTNLATRAKLIKFTVIISIFAVVLGWIITIFLFINHINTTSDKIYLINNEGNILTANYIKTNESRPKEAEAHVRLFIRLFFEVNKLSYINNYNQSFDLGGSRITTLYKQLETNGWIKHLISNNMIIGVDIKTVMAKNIESPYTVTSHFIIALESEIFESTKYDVTLTFIVRGGNGNNRTDSNPHDMWINDVNIDKWEQIQ